MKRVDLPLSKSVVAREAVMAAISGGVMPESGGSEDGEVVVKALTVTDGVVNVRSSGTAARFAIAYYGSREGVRVVDGSEQLRQRPVGAIVDAMRRLGAKIEYMGESGRLPVRIEGCSEIGTEVEADAQESSQTISALMLIGARKGLRIRLRGDAVSSTYIDLTRMLMEKAGVEVRLKDDVIDVAKGVYLNLNPNGLQIDRDWSSAVFWYGMVAVGEEKELLLKGLRMNSGQPDERAVELFARLGVESKETPEGVMIQPFDKLGTSSVVNEDCKGCPDIVPVLVATLCRLERRFNITGIQTLERKESRRGSVLVREMGKLGYRLGFDGENIWWNGEKCAICGVADAADDHRIAMALLVAGAKLTDTECINKSYKEIWKNV